MIFVILGTQNMPFTRLLDAVEKQAKQGIIKDEIIVQAGVTKYTSSYMKVFDLIPSDEFEDLVNKADLIITHAGVGSILSAITLGKVTIAAARDKKYKEHVNNHQYEILERFMEDGYVLGLTDFDKLDDILIKAKSFVPKPYVSTRNILISKIDDFMNSH